MESGNRMSGESIVPTVARRTPNNDFGAVMANTAREVVRSGAGVVAALAPGLPGMSAAVASVAA